MNKPDPKEQDIEMSLEEFMLFVMQEQDKNWEEDRRWDREHPNDED